MTVELLTRAGCAACAAARSELTRICADMGVGFTEVDVDEAAEGGRPDVRAEFGGDEHSYWEVDEPRLRADLAARR